MHKMSKGAVLPAQVPRVGRLELQLLALIQHEREGVTGSELWKELERLEGRPFSSGTVYTTLYRLQDKRLVDRQAGESNPVRGGKAQTYYRLTTLGGKTLQHYSQMISGVALAAV